MNLFMIEVEALKQEAIEKTGFDDFGDPFFDEPLAAWVYDLPPSPQPSPSREWELVY